MGDTVKHMFFQSTNEFLTLSTPSLSSLIEEQLPLCV